MRTIFTHPWLTQLTHSIRQKTTESRRNRRMAQKGYECFGRLLQSLLPKAPCLAVPLMSQRNPKQNQHLCPVPDPGWAR